MIYYLKTADIYDIVPNTDNRKYRYLVRCKENNKDYFVKPSWKNHFHNENEYIAHHIASAIGAPVPDGMFLQISPQNMQAWHEYMQDRENYFNPVFMPPYESAVFFGVEVLRATHVETIEQLRRNLSDAANHSEFYAQFPLDQHLKNPDRHINNYFFHLKNGKKHFCLIDFDRLFFGATDWSMLDDVDDFSCFTTKGYNADLYDIVESSTLAYVHEYAARLDRLSDAEVDDIIQTMSKIYPRTKPYLGKIGHWIKSRRDAIYEWCLKNERCYKSVTRRGVFSDYR